MSKIETVPLADLVEDMALYPRHAVDMTHVQSLVLALQAGATLPPIVADRKSKRITDGVHRGRAYKRFLGPGCTVDVEFVAYKNETEMLLDAVARNAAHGRRLDAIDKTRSVIMLRQVGCNDEQISTALGVTPERVSKLVVRVASAPKSASGTVPGTSTITLKRPVLHMAGSRLTKSQAEAHGMMPGTSFLLIARQLATALHEGMVNLEDERLVEQLAILRDELTAALAVTA